MADQSRNTTEPEASPTGELSSWQRGKAVAGDRPCAGVTPREASYLLALHALQGGAAPPTQVALARAVNVSAPTALEMVRRLRTLGLVDPERLALTTEGTSAVLLLATRRRAALVLTQDVLGLDDQDAAPEAERLAPNLSAALARRLLSSRPERP